MTKGDGPGILLISLTVRLNYTMNSPPDHGSPASTSSSESPPPEEVSPAIGGGSSYLSNLTSHITNIGNFSGPSKRRLPQGSSFGAASSTRDPKTRRRERERERGEPSRPGHTAWEKEPGKKELKDDLLDQGLVDHLRKGVPRRFLFFPPPWYVYSIYMYGFFFSEIGDPFLEIGIKC